MRMDYFGFLNGYFRIYYLTLGKMGNIAMVLLQFTVLLLQSVLVVIGMYGLIWGCLIEATHYGHGGFHLKDLTLNLPSTVLIVYGSLIAFVSSLGLISHLRRSMRVMRISAILMVFILLIDCGGTGVFYRTNAVDVLLTEMKTTLGKYNVDKEVRVGMFAWKSRSYWDRIQTKGTCCGMTSYMNWINSGLKEINVFPSSCCKSKGCEIDIFTKIMGISDEEGSTMATVPSGLLGVYENGCMEFQTDIIEFFRKHLAVGPIIGGILVIYALLVCILGEVIKCARSDRILFGFVELIRCGRNRRVASDEMDMGLPEKLSQRYNVFVPGTGEIQLAILDPSHAESCLDIERKRKYPPWKDVGDVDVEDQIFPGAIGEKSPDTILKYKSAMSIGAMQNNNLHILDFDEDSMDEDSEIYPNSTLNIYSPQN